MVVNMIKTWTGKRAAAVWKRKHLKGMDVEVTSRALRVLEQLHAAHSLQDLRVPPSNRLHRLRGDSRGQYSLSVNEQYLICFRWEGGDAFDVEFTDYH